MHGCSSAVSDESLTSHHINPCRASSLPQHHETARSAIRYGNQSPGCADEMQSSKNRQVDIKALLALLSLDTLLLHRPPLLFRSLCTIPSFHCSVSNHIRFSRHSFSEPGAPELEERTFCKLQRSPKEDIHHEVHERDHGRWPLQHCPCTGSSSSLRWGGAFYGELLHSCARDLFLGGRSCGLFIPRLHPLPGYRHHSDRECSCWDW